MTALDDPRQFAEQLVVFIDRTFQHAYCARMIGVTETELLIDLDIDAAYHGTEPHILDVIRKTVKNAVRAVDAHVDYPLAHKFLLTQLRTHIDQLIAEQADRQAHKATTHAMVKD
jgi:hypothetical protein